MPQKMDEALKLKTTSIRLSQTTIDKMLKYKELTGMEQSTIIRMLIEDALPEPLFSKKSYDDSCINKWIEQGLPEERLISVICALLEVAFKEYPQMARQFTLATAESPTFVSFDHRQPSPSLFILAVRILNVITVLKETVAVECYPPLPPYPDSPKPEPTHKIDDQTLANDQIKIDRVQGGLPPDETKFD
jgi:hypothetical protein